MTPGTVRAMSPAELRDPWSGHRPGDLDLVNLVPGAARPMMRRIGDRDVIWIDVDQPGDVVRLSAITSAKIECGLTAGRDIGLPVVLVLSSAGADIIEGMPALDAWGRVAAALASCSGRVPTIAVVDGPAVSGPALLLGLADFTVMTETSYAFVNGPVMVEEFTGVGIDVDELGGATTHARYTGVATMVVADRDTAIGAVENLLEYLPDSTDAEPARWPCDDPADRSCPEAGAQIPPTSTGSYDVRKVAEAIVDEDSLFELRDRWATNVVTAFAHHRRTPGWHRGEPAPLARRDARHPGVPEGRPVRRVLRRVQSSDHHARRHARLLSGQGSGVARDDPSRGATRVRLRPGDRATHLRDPAQELRRGVHRDGFQDDGQRPLPRVARRRTRRDGRRAGGGDPAAASDARRAGRVRGRLRRASAQPVRRRGTRAMSTR